jgi:hypothetical protein
MKATNWLIISWIVFFAATGIADSIRRAMWDVGIIASFAIFFPVLLILLAFCRRRRPWAFLGTVVFGIFIVVTTGITALIGFYTEFTYWTSYGLLVSNVLSILLALEGAKAYIESKGP